MSFDSIQELKTSADTPDTLEVDASAELPPRLRIYYSRRRPGCFEEKLVAEVCSHLVEHNGPDDDGVCHPDRRRIRCEVLCQALARAQELGFCLGIEPFHFSGMILIEQGPKIRDETLKRKVNHLLRERFGGKLIDLLAEVTSYDLLSPFPDVVGDRTFVVGMSDVRHRFSTSAFELVTRYLKLVGRTHEFAGFRPYHMNRAPDNIYDDPAILDEVLQKKCGGLLRDKFGGDLFKLATEVTAQDLRSALVETIGGRVISVSMDVVSCSFGYSLYRMVCRYIELAGKKEELSGYRPYHMSTASMRTYSDPTLVDEVLGKKISQLLRDRFSNDIGRFISEVTQGDLLSPLVDNVGKRPVIVSMGSVGQRLGNSYYRMVCRYLQFTDKWSHFNGLRPYHLARASQRTYSDPAVVDEVLRKKVSALLQEKFAGALGRLLAEVTLDDLTSPLMDPIGSTIFTVCMGQVAHYFDDSPYKMAARYLGLVAKAQEFSGFRPYHMNKAPNNIYDDPAVLDEVLQKKCTRLLLEKFDGDLLRLAADVTTQDLLSPLVELIGGHAFTISMSRVAYHFGDSPRKMIDRFFEIRGGTLPC